eukprot:scaffold406_cov57-Cylindrotheca_fusiformis.AAC.14
MCQRPSSSPVRPPWVTMSNNRLSPNIKVATNPNPAKSVRFLQDPLLVTSIDPSYFLDLTEKEKLWWSAEELAGSASKAKEFSSQSPPAPPPGIILLMIFLTIKCVEPSLLRVTLLPELHKFRMRASVFAMLSRALSLFCYECDHGAATTKHSTQADAEQGILRSLANN